MIGCVLPPAATSHANNNQLGGGETVPQFHCLLTKNPSHQPFPSPNKRMLTRSRRTPALSAQEKRYLERQRRQRQPSKASSKSAKSKPSKGGQRKRKDNPASSTSPDAKQASTSGGKHAASDDLVAHAANALCLMQVQQEQTTVGSVVLFYSVATNNK